MRRLYRPILLLLILAAWAWRLHGLDAQSLWRDEVDSLRFATRPLAESLAMFRRPGENGPLYFLLLRPWLMAAGQSEFALRFPSALMGVLAIPLLYVWGRRWFGATVGLVAALLLAANPYHLWYSQEAKMYALLVVVIMLSLAAFVWALERGRWWRWAIWLVATTACFYIHVLGVFVIPLEVVWFLLVPAWRRRWLGFGLALVALVLPYVPLVWWQWKLLVDPSFSTGHTFMPLGRVLQTLWQAQIQGILLAPSPWLLAAPIFLLLAGIVLPSLGERAAIYPSPPTSANLRLALAWWFLPVLCVFFLSLAVPIFLDRYLIWVMPALVLLLAVGAVAVSRQNRWVAVVLLLVLIAFQLWNGWRQDTHAIKSDFRSAAAFVAANRQPDDLTLFLIPYIRHTYQYYDRGVFPWADAPYTNRESDAAVLDQRMSELTRGYPGVWLVESEPEFYDRQGLVRGWLESHGQRQEEAEFARVGVRYYRVP